MKANKKNAVKYYRKAADAGIADGMYNLAVLYAKGDGTRKDMIQAYKWATIAAKHSPSDADRRGAKHLLAALDSLASSNEKRLAKAGAAKWKPRQ